MLEALPLTVDDLERECQGLLETCKETTERAVGWEFVCRLREGAGVVAGLFSRSRRQIIELVVFGKGRTWSKVASKCAALASQDQSAVYRIDSILKTSERAGQDYQTMEVGAISFEQVRFGDGQRLLKIKTVSRTERNGTPALTLAEARALPEEALKRLTYEKASNALAEWWNRFPSLGMELTEFKERLDGWMARTAAGLHEQSDINREGDKLTLMLPGKTFLSANAPNDVHVCGVSVEGTLKNESEFWFCVEAAIAALNPLMPEATRQGVVSRLRRKKGSQPSESFGEFVQQDVLYTYRRDRKCCVVLIKRA